MTCIARILSLAGSATVIGLFTGCSTIFPRVEINEAPVVPVVVEPTPQNNGAIFQATAYRPMFEDHRARLPGDSLIVSIVEKVSASQKSTSSIDKTGKIDASISALPGLPAGALRRAGASGSSANSFEGKGATENTNDFSGTITVIVRQVLPNGHLLIAGEKQIGVNNNVDVLRFSGQVDPRSIQPGNVVQSAQIANVRVEHRGKGAQAEAQAMGWLGRVFLSVLPI